jgi:hypothetical protein
VFIRIVFAAALLAALTRARDELRAGVSDAFLALVQDRAR